MDGVRLAEIEQRRDQLKLQLQIIMASDVPPRVKTARIKHVTRELVDMKAELKTAIEQENCTHGVAVVLNTGVGRECKCSKCDKTWESGDAYFQEMIAKEKADAEEKKG